MAKGEIHGMTDSANPQYPVAGDCFKMTQEEHEALRVEGTANTLYERHAARMAKAGHLVPKWGWISEAQQETWRQLARERIEQDASVGADVVEGYL